MQLTWADIKQSVRKLCFLESDEYADYDAALIEAVNYALLCAARRFPLIEKYEIAHTPQDADGYDTYDMRTLTLNELNTVTFMGFDAAAPTLEYTEEGFVPIGFTILADRYLIIPKRYEGNVTAVYYKYPEKIGLLTPDSHIIEFGAEVAALIPLIMAWRVFKDDDERKAAMYYNEYIEAAKEISPKDGLTAPVLVYEPSGAVS